MVRATSNIDIVSTGSDRPRHFVSSSGSAEESRSVSADYEFRDYKNNWSYWNPEHKQKYPESPSGVDVEVGFAVVKPDGTFDERYPLGPGADQWSQGAPPNGYAFAVGGWNNSQETPGSQNPAFGGLFEVMASEDDSVRQRLINEIVTNAKKYGYKSVTIDYEAFGHSEQKATYTKFMHDLAAACYANGLECGMAISPDKANQTYFDLKDIASDPNIDYIQLMTYDYNRGFESPIPVEDNAGIAQTVKYLKKIAKVVPLNKIAVGIPFYSLCYNIDSSMTLDQVKEQLKSGTLVANSYHLDPVTKDSTITDDDLLALIGDWKYPKDDWVLLTDGNTPQGYFYYNSSEHLLISAFPPQAIESFSETMKKEFPEIKKIFAYEGQGDFKGVMMKNLVDSFNK